MLMLFIYSTYFLLQDAYAIQSFERGIAAQKNGHLAWEIVPVRFLFSL